MENDKLTGCDKAKILLFLVGLGALFLICNHYGVNFKN